MYKDGDYRGLSLEEVILAIHDELRENRAFLQMSLYILSFPFRN